MDGLCQTRNVYNFCVVVYCASKSSCLDKWLFIGYLHIEYVPPTINLLCMLAGRAFMFSFVDEKAVHFCCDVSWKTAPKISLQFLTIHKHTLVRFESIILTFHLTHISILTCRL
jgi:hypothetical protein